MPDQINQYVLTRGYLASSTVGIIGTVAVTSTDLMLTEAA